MERMTLRISDQAPGDSGLETAVKRATDALRRLPPLFIWIVLAPGALAVIYYLLLASPVYVSTAKFIVRAPTPSAGVAPTGLNAVLQGVGLAPAATDSFVVQDYMTSRDAIDMLDQNVHLREMLARSPTDFLARFPRPFEMPTLENLARAYPRFVTVTYNSSTGVSTLEVKAFRPQDAKAIATDLLDGGEVLVNHLNDRADQDAIRDTKRQVEEAEAEVAKSEDILTAFRNQQRLIDPARSSQVNLELMGKLQSDIATLRAERAAVAAGAPQSPQLPGLDSRIRAYEAQAQDQQTDMAGANTSLASVIGQYERLTLDRDFAEKTLASAAAAGEEARLEAQRKRLYLERISQPSLADSAAGPQRLASLGTVFFTLLLIYAIVALMLAGFREHRQR
jgi:capsular polysaccharide transport system permease protein